jgi:hypothetical protein
MSRRGKPAGEEEQEMPAQPRRRPVRNPHLDAHIVPVERALIARAEVMDERAKDILGDPDAGADLLTGTVLAGMAQEFRALAEECHWWG